MLRVKYGRSAFADVRARVVSERPGPLQPSNAPRMYVPNLSFH